MGKSASKESSGSVNIKPMLTTAQKNFREVSHPPSVLGPGGGGGEVRREDLTVPGAQVFLLHGLLSQSECAHYISQTETIGYSGLSDVFPADYRSNDRVLSICQPLVDELWRRIEPLMTRNEVIRVRPVGFGNEGTWKPFRLNECCKFGRYKCDGHFSPHIDGPWVPREDESSIFTVVIYLNSDFEGGATNFLNESDQSKVLCSVTPRTGSALIFNHDTLHEGEAVRKGTKYLIRTEIMYRRVDTEMLVSPGAYQYQEGYIKTLTLYKKSWELEQVGDVKAFTDTYLEAIELQRQAQSSIPSQGTALHLPHELYLEIFGYLPAKDVCNCLTVCKAWYDICMDGQLWYDLYRQNWPVGIKLEASIDLKKSSLKFVDERPFLRDWYGHYKQRVKCKQPQKVVVLDLGSFSFKCAALHRAHSTIRKSSIESVVALVPGVFDIHMRRFSYDRYFCGIEAKTRFPDKLVSLVVNGEVDKPHMLPEIVTGLFLDCRIRPKFTPVIILEPPGLWTDDMRKAIAVMFIKKFLNPSVSFLNSAVATLCYLDLLSGVVLDVGHGVVTCAVVWNREMANNINCSPEEATPVKLAHMVHDTVKSSRFSCEQQQELQSHVVLTGGKSCRAELMLGELNKIDRSYCVLPTTDVQYSGVLGGCNIANLSIFNSVNESLVSQAKLTKHSLDKKWQSIWRPESGEFYIPNPIGIEWYNFLNEETGRDVEDYLFCMEDDDVREQWLEDVEEDKLFRTDFGEGSDGHDDADSSLSSATS